MSKVGRMYSLPKCRNCNAESHLIAYGVVAPWISEKCGINESLVNLLKCDNCELVFFDRGYDLNEMNTIYYDYRSVTYWQARFKWEPWLRLSSANELADSESISYLLRRQFLYRVLENTKIDLAELQGVVDFGGDLGQFIPKEITGTKIVVDKSVNVPHTSNGIYFTNSLNSESVTGVDLVMACHVFEHILDFQEILHDMIKKINPGGYLYIEVPVDNFKVKKFHQSPSYRSLLKWLVREKIIFIALDFLTGLSRTIYSRIPYFGIVKQSEHINYFSHKTLQVLANNLNVKILSYVKQNNMSQGRIKIGSQGILLQKPYL